MAAKFLIRNGGWLLSKTRFSSERTISPFLNKRPLLTASAVEFDKKSNRLVVNWKDNITDEYPVVWLRDNCQCPACFDQSSQSRNTIFSKLQLDLKPTNSAIEDSNVVLHWEDDHKTDFESIPTFDFQAVMKDDVALLEWLQTLDCWGVSRLENVPNSLGQAGNLANRVGFIKPTHYELEFNVRATANANNLAYTEGPLQLHTDLPIYEYMPGINILQCYIQYSGDGGDSLVVDRFQIAELLRDIDPDAFKCLSGTEVNWYDIVEDNGNHFHKTNRVPIICETSDQKIKRINFHNSMRDSHLAIPIDQVDSWYRALKKFYDLALDPRNLAEFKLHPGQMITFDNLRVLHGRTTFGETIKGERHLQGAYLDWDEARSKIRVLKHKLAKQ